MTDPTTHDLAVKIAALEERMNTKQAEYKTDIALLAKESTERETRHLRWTIGVVATAAAIIIAALKWL